MSVTTFNVRLRGRVQRVGYRRFVLDTAQEMGIDGYVSNQEDGSVTIFAQGESQLLQTFPDSLKKTPTQATIKSIDVEQASPDPILRGFKISYGPLEEELKKASAPYRLNSETTETSSKTTEMNPGT